MKKLITLIFTFSLLCGTALAQNYGIPGVDYNAQATPQIINEITGESVLTTLAWTSLAPSVNAYSRSCVAYITIGGNDYIYQFGGGSTTQHTQVARYDVAANTWSNTGFAPIPTGMSTATAVTIGDKIYVFGGQSTAGLGKTYMYDPVANTWATKANMLTLVTDALVVKSEDNNYVYVIGGGDGLFGTTVFSSVQLYNVATDTYTACTSLPVAVSMLGGGILNYTIIATGGWIGAAGPGNTYKGVIDPGNPTQITWTTVTAYPAGGVTRMASFPAVLGTYPAAAGIFFTGGAVGGATLTGATHLYNFCTDAWEVLTPSLAQPRSNFKGCGKMDNDVYVVGGFTTVGVGTTDKATLTAIAGNCYTPVPVELTSFIASVIGSDVRLLWETASELNNSGFSVERTSANSEYTEVGFVPGFGTTTEAKSYSFSDQNLQNGNYTYRLKQIDFDGTFEYSQEVEVEVSTPATFNLEQNYPNPFNPSTSIKYSVPEPGNIRISVYNTVGEEVAVLVNGFSQAGSFEVTFDASNLSTGVYLYKLQSANSVQTKKMMLLK
ncbi:MAG TPA: kelch repeat-containing protein [Ignavibacteriaceae bacterium]|nr:kelch repeat-containing protein [Ignavibacteriaceae bacterium]